MSPHAKARAAELEMREDDFIVSKTNAKGIITYANRTFIEFAGYVETELLGHPHNIIRHPDMPRAVFRLMWRTPQEGQEFFGYIKNLSKDGSFYWTFANVTPKFDAHGDLLGYFSVRRKPSRSKLLIVDAIYREMLTAEQTSSSAQTAMNTAEAVLTRALGPRTYHEFILTLWV